MGGVETPENVPTRRRAWRVLRKVLLISVVIVVLLVGFFGTVFVIAYRDAAHGNAGQLSFTNPLAVPPVLEPRVDDIGRKHFDLDLRTGNRELLPGKATATWGVNGDFLGPTLRVQRGDNVAVHVNNRLPESTSLHWHGMRLPASMDGGPHQEIDPNTTWSPEWTVKQPAATLWYHPHLHGRTAGHVYRGVSGMFLVDDEKPVLPNEYGVDDVPLIVQDKRFTPDGQFDMDTDPLARTVGADPAGPLGDQILVNGTHDPHFTVTSTLTRFRVLNGSTARIYHLGFTDDRPFHVVGTDTGQLPAPEQVRRVVVGPWRARRDRRGDATGRAHGAAQLPRRHRHQLSRHPAGRRRRHVRHPPTARGRHAAAHPRTPGDTVHRTPHRRAGERAGTGAGPRRPAVDQRQPHGPQPHRPGGHGRRPGDLGGTRRRPAAQPAHPRRGVPHPGDRRGTAARVAGAAARTPSTYPLARRRGWRSSSAPTSTRRRRTCTTATCSATRTTA